MVETSVVSPLFNTFSMPAKVKSPGSIEASINAVYGARAMSKAIENIDFENPIIMAKMQLRTKSCHGFSDSVIGPPNARNNCQIVIRNKTAHAVYCKIVNALVINGKYCSIAVMSVPSAFKKIPDVESIKLETTLASQSATPSKIQSNILPTR